MVESATKDAHPPVGAPVTHSDAFTLRRYEPRIYYADIRGYFSLGVMGQILSDIWSDPEWKQPWNLILRVSDTTGYDLDLRKHKLPAPDKRAVGTAIVSTNPLHRMVLKAAGVSYRITHRFYLSAHDTFEDALGVAGAGVERAERAGQPF